MSTEQDPLLDPTTFVPPSLESTTVVTIEFCDRCRWLHRASWVQTELLLTFPPPTIGCVVLLPRNSDETAGRFRVWVTKTPATNGEAAAPPQLAWDRKVEGGFPELKVLKQRIRDIVQPGKSLGHSDKKPAQ
ncbi:Rdx family-domain-containing protein [Mycena olivaceomarginata]|uniref:Rdx family-domain-containing protein n=1 Tax=Mycena albidolilacea TaxID=1033008 RepID=A0AAD7F026_9AGAR|nr:Rdx family-domain-containing protein [Mycena albidolilacea]KAJ7819911.1 Rdx family-domain-containing protein [Mycena olivaceomarginata]